MKKFILCVIGAVLLTGCSGESNVVKETKTNYIPPNQPKATTTATTATTTQEETTESYIDRMKKRAKKRKDYANCSLTYNDLARYPDKYEDEYVCFTGTIAQVIDEHLEEDGLYWSHYLMNINDDYDQTIYLLLSDDVESRDFRILDDDKVKIYGIAANVWTYETTLGSNRTVPVVYAFYCDIMNDVPVIEYNTTLNIDLPEVIATSGTYKIGVDIPAGKYMALSTDSSGAYLSVNSDANGNDIVFNENFECNYAFEVVNGEYLKLDDCVIIDFDKYYENNKVPYDTINGGVFLRVGVDIPAGEYKLVANEDDGYYAIYSNLRDDIVDNDFFEGSAYMTIQNGQYVKIEDCQISK